MEVCSRGLGLITYITVLGLLSRYNVLPNECPCSIRRTLVAQTYATKPFTHSTCKACTENRLDFRRFFRTGVGVVQGLEKSRLLSPDCSCHHANHWTHHSSTSVHNCSFNGSFSTYRLYRAIAVWNIYCVGPGVGGGTQQHKQTKWKNAHKHALPPGLRGDNLLTPWTHVSSETSVHK